MRTQGLRGALGHSVLLATSPLYLSWHDTATAGLIFPLAGICLLGDGPATHWTVVLEASALPLRVCAFCKWALNF